MSFFCLALYVDEARRQEECMFEVRLGFNHTFLDVVERGGLVDLTCSTLALGVEGPTPLRLAPVLSDR